MVRTYGSVSTGTGQAGPPLLPTRSDITHPPMAEPLTARALALTHGSSERARRAETIRLTKLRLRRKGKAWKDARAWAATTGQWMPAQMPPGNLNPDIVDAYLKHLAEEAKQ